MLHRDDYNTYRDNFHKLLSCNCVRGIAEEIISLRVAVADTKCWQDSLMMGTGSRERGDTLRERLTLGDDWSNGAARHPAFNTNLGGTLGRAFFASG